ncbi:MAG: hypothetical protein PHD97_04745 [Bacteroidales bacterium]|nr:hypothetical protein [Bacteroidales bacterium]
MNKFQIKIRKTDILYVFVVLLLFSMLSCKKEYFELDKRLASTNKYDPNISLPLVHSKLTIEDIVAGSDTTQIFKFDPNNVVILVYKGNLCQKTAKEVYSEIPDQNFSYPCPLFPMPPGPPAGDSTSANYNPIFTFTTTGEQFDSITLKGGTLRFHLNSSDFNHQAKFEITLPNVIKNGTPFTTTILYTYSGSLPVDITNDFDLTGYTIAFTPGNQITANIKVTGYYDANPNTSPYNFTFETSFLSSQYSGLYGYLGQKNINFAKDTIRPRIFKNNFIGNMEVENPQMIISINNSFGLPINANFNTLQAFSPVNAPNVVNIGGPGLTNPLAVGYPSMLQIGQTIPTNVTLDNTNSNIVDAINISPQKFYSDISATTNPSGTPMANFVLDTSKISVNLEVDIPLTGVCWDFIIQDTMPAGSFIEDVKEMKWAKFRIFAENWFPVNAIMQIYFTDSVAGNKYHIADSLITTTTDKVVDAAAQGLGPDFRVASPTIKYTEVLVDNDKLKKLENCNNMIIRAIMNTANYPTGKVRIYNDYILDVKLSVQAQLDVTF